MYGFVIGSYYSIIDAIAQKKKRWMKNLKFNLCQKKYKTDRELYDKVKKVIKFDLNRNQKDKMEFS